MAEFWQWWHGTMEANPGLCWFLIAFPIGYWCGKLEERSRVRKVG
jgi:hypothetical protein